MKSAVAIRKRLRTVIDPGFRPEATPTGITVRLDSARLFISVEQPDGGTTPTWIALTSPLLLRVHRTKELLTYVAIHTLDFRIGHLGLIPISDELVDVVLSHQLLGDSLGAQQLNSAIAMMLIVANDLDDELQMLFGGDRFHED